MRYLLALIVFLSMYLSGEAQQNHFIYLQTENKQPFYVKFDGKVFSSSYSGYLILSKLTSGNYKLIIGFPKNVFPEQVFNCVIDNKDEGFLLKNFGEKGWGLTDLQTSDVTMAGDVIVKKPLAVRENSSDPFSNMLANVVQDTTINRKELIEVPVKESPKLIQDNQESPAVVSSSEPKDKPVTADQSVANPETVANTESTGASQIKRTIRKKNKEGLQLVYVDQYNNHSDTISVLMPVEKVEKNNTGDSTNKKATTSTDLQPAVQNGDSSQTTALIPPPVKNIPPAVKEPVINSEPPRSEIKNADPPVQTKPEATLREQPKFIEYKDSTSGKNGASKSGMINSDCKAMATDDDFIKIRKKMAGENNDDDMTRVAKKYFKSKCFTTEQVKNLSVLFLKDEGKYTFFEASYPFVSDSDSFQSLVSQLTDSYYINRFNAMIHH